MAGYIITQDGTKISTQGLSPDQVSRLKTMDKGTKAAALAQQFAKQNATTSAASSTTTDQSTSLNPAQQDRLKFLLKHRPDDPQVKKLQSMLGQAGGTGTDGTTGTSDTSPVTGQTSVEGQGALSGAGNTFNKSLTGAPGTLDTSNEQNWLTGSKLDLTGQPTLIDQGDATKLGNDAANANYKFITQHYADNKQQEMDKAKQDLANRGIPIDPDPNSLYGRTLKSIDNKYQDLNDQANNQAISLGNETATGAVNQNTAARQSFLTSATSQHEADLADLQANAGLKKLAHDEGISDITQLAGVLQGMTAQDLAKYGIDLDAKTKMAQVAASIKNQKTAAAAQTGAASISGAAGVGEASITGNAAITVGAGHDQAAIQSQPVTYAQ